MAIIYHINKGVNKPIEFKGLKAQYISYLAIGLVILLIFFASMYIVGVNLFVCIIVIFTCGIMLFVSAFRLSNKYGQYGLLKKAAKRYIPISIKVRSRTMFIHLSGSRKIRR
ncbi:DUF4133 domain-containing protein [Pedobacter sp. P351]|uniref:DUF4133 domain-containing protein n=1 Tax=Pedobacter superstes TaxID=3133441 RepID=UPI0030A0E344